MYKFVIPALNTEKLLNNLIKNYEIFNIKKENNNLIFYCKIKNKNKIKKILNKYGINPTVAINTGVLNIFNYFSYGILFGIIFSILIFIFSSFFITNIIIYGNINFCSDEIYEVLKEENIKPFTLKSKVDTTNLNNKLSNIKFVSFASSIIKGNSIVINIKEQLTNREVTNIDCFEPIVSKYDGQITSINLIQGTLACKVGDIVKLGDILVLPYVEDSSGNKLSVQPLADIVCDVWITSKLIVFDKEIKKVRTNKVITNYELLCFGTLLYKNEKPNVFELFECEDKMEYVTNCLLPIKICYHTIYECKMVEIENNFDKNKEIFIDKCRSIALLNVKDYDIIKSESCDVTKSENLHEITYTLTVSKKVS